MERMERSFIKNGKNRKEWNVLLKRTDAQPWWGLAQGAAWQGQAPGAAGQGQAQGAAGRGKAPGGCSTRPGTEGFWTRPGTRGLLDTVFVKAWDVQVVGDHIQSFQSLADLAGT